MDELNYQAVSSFCDAAANIIGDFEQAVVANLSDEAAKIVETLVELDADCRNGHDILRLIHRDGQALRRLLLDDNVFDCHAEWSNAVAATARNVERLCARMAAGGSMAH